MMFKFSRPACLLALLIAATPVRGLAQGDQVSGTFTSAGDMTTARSFHTATLLPDGKVLIAGGQRSTSLVGRPTTLASTELYDPITGKFTASGDMTTARRLHTATLLPDGRVLIAGGYDAAGPAISAELYDPATGVFTATGAMLTARGAHSAILLTNGKVLMVGGSGTAAYPSIPPAELYDAASGSFTQAGDYVGKGGCDFCAPSVLLPDGTVLVPVQYPAQVFNPLTESFTVSGLMISSESTAALLLNGHVLFAGGEDVGRMSNAELFDPLRGAFTATGDMGSRRVWHSLTLLPNGTVLAAGGETESCSGGPGGGSCGFAGSVASAELYDPSTGTFRATGSMVLKRETHTATLLNDGRVLIAGGMSYGGIGIFSGSGASAELYTPAELVAAPVLMSVGGNGQTQGVIYHGRTYHLADRDDPATAGEMIDIVCKGLSKDGVIPPRVVIGGRLAEIVSFGPAPGLSGTNRVSVIMPAGIPIGPNVGVRLIYLDRSSNDVTMAVN